MEGFLNTRGRVGASHLFLEKQLQRKLRNSPLCFPICETHPSVFWKSNGSALYMLRARPWKQWCSRLPLRMWSARRRYGYCSRLHGKEKARGRRCDRAETNTLFEHVLFNKNVPAHTLPTRPWEQWYSHPPRVWNREKTRRPQNWTHPTKHWTSCKQNQRPHSTKLNHT